MARRRARCDLLAAALTAASVERFDRRAVEVVSAHAAGCDVCAEHRRLRLEPAALFGAVPLVSAPALLKSKVGRGAQRCRRPHVRLRRRPGRVGCDRGGFVDVGQRRRREHRRCVG